MYDISVEPPFAEDDIFFINDTQVQIWNPIYNVDSHGNTNSLDSFMDIPGIHEAFQTLIETQSNFDNVSLADIHENHSFLILSSESYSKIPLAASSFLATKPFLLIFGIISIIFLCKYHNQAESVS